MNNCWPWWLQPPVEWPFFRAGVFPQNPPWSCQDVDNFIRNRITAITGGAIVGYGAGAGVPEEMHSGTPALTLSEIKMHLRIEENISNENGYLMFLEAAARRFTENVVRYALDPGCSAALKEAMLLLIAAWYRVREAISSEANTEYGLAYAALVSPEKYYGEFY